MKRHINEFRHTEFANSGRVAGMGILYDRYDEESGAPIYGGSVMVQLPCDYLTPEQKLALSGPVICYKVKL